MPIILYILEYMDKIILELDKETLTRLERVAPARSRKRSEFLRMAIRKALWDLEERETAEAYARMPDSAGDAYIDPRVWEKPASRRRRPRRKS
jgi:predicted transcriptional regulator